MEPSPQGNPPPPAEAGAHDGEAPKDRQFWEPARHVAIPRDALPRRRGRTILISMLVVLVLVGGAVTVAYKVPRIAIALGLRPDPRVLATRAGSTFLSDWQAGDYAGMQALVLDPKDSMVTAYGGLAHRLKVTKTTVVPGALDAAGTSMPYTATLTLGALGDVSWSGVVQLASTTQDTWRVRFTADTVYPGLANGQRLDLQTIGATTRGRVLDRGGEPLRDDIDLEGNLVGKMGKNGVGATGLERFLNAQLVGRPATQLAIVNATNGSAVTVLKNWDAEPGKDVKTTIDLSMQRAAERALIDVSGRAALVAIDTQTGEVRAMASHPTSGLAAAFALSFAPGSTFKIVTATAAMIAGATPQTPVQCTPTVTVNGRVFKNAEAAPARTLTLTQAFAESCNTAFIRLSQTLPDAALESAAKLYGFDGSKPLPINSVSGSIPPPSGSVEAAADAIGQGRVEASPLQLASVAAAVASGTWHQPHVLANCTCASNALPAAVAAGLRPMMRAVVTSGTGIAASKVAGEPVYGKTGTAEFGNATPLKTHAWFVGWQGTTAFAVFVDEGAFGGTVAAPIAAHFLAWAANS